MKCFDCKCLWLLTFYAPTFLCHILECSNGHSSFWNWAKGSRVRDVFSLGFLGPMYMIQASQVEPVVKNLPAMQEILRDAGSIPGWRRSPEGGHGNPLQYSCLENPMDGGAWWTTVYRVAKSQRGLKQLSTHTCVNMIHSHLQLGYYNILV